MDKVELFKCSLDLLMDLQKKDIPISENVLISTFEAIYYQSRIDVLFEQLLKI